MFSSEILRCPTQSHSNGLQSIPTNTREDAELPTFYFHIGCRIFKFKPTVDIIASAAHDRIARYYTLDPQYRNAAGVKAFRISWTDEVRPYNNPPLCLVRRVLT